MAGLVADAVAFGASGSNSVNAASAEPVIKHCTINPINSILLVLVLVLVLENL